MRTLKALFTSEVRVKALRRLVLAGVQELAERDLARTESLPLPAMRRELARLGTVGLVKTRLAHRRRLYRAETTHPYYPELKAFFLKATFFEGKFRELEKARKKIRVAFVFGSVARAQEDEASDLDLAIVGDVSWKDGVHALEPSMTAIGRELNSTTYTPKEFREKYREKGGFVERIVKTPKIFLIGSENDLTAILEGEAAHPA